MNKCRTLLFMPGNNPGMLASSQNLGADIVIFDLEDAVAQTEKDAARNLVRNALLFITERRANIMVRMNGTDTPFWQADIEGIVMGGADHIMMPKCMTGEQIRDVIGFLESMEKKHKREAKITLVGIIESALGVENAFDVASAHGRFVGILLGAEDLTADLGAQRTAKGDEIRYARSRVLTACKAAGIKAIDTPFPFVTDIEGLNKDAAFAAQLGFDGKASISPQHVVPITEAFMPKAEQIAWAQRVMAVAKRAEEEGKGAVSLDGMMIDLPIIKRATRILSFI